MRLNFENVLRNRDSIHRVQNVLLTAEFGKFYCTETQQTAIKLQETHKLRSYFRQQYFSFGNTLHNLKYEKQYFIYYDLQLFKGYDLCFIPMFLVCPVFLCIAQQKLSLEPSLFIQQVGRNRTRRLVCIQIINIYIKNPSCSMEACQTDSDRTRKFILDLFSSRNALFVQNMVILFSKKYIY